MKRLPSNSGTSTSDQPRPPLQTFANRFAVLRLTQAPTNPTVDQLMHDGSLTQENLNRIIHWCCDNGEPSILDEVLKAAAESNLAIVTVSIAADNDEDTAAALTVLGRHPAVHSIELFRAEGDQTIGATVGQLSAQALHDVLVGSAANPSCISHLAVNSRIRGYDLAEVLLKLSESVEVAPSLESFAFDNEVPIRRLKTLVTCVARNTNIARVGLNLSGDGLESSHGELIAQLLSCSNISSVRLTCANPWVHAGFLGALATLETLSRVLIVELDSAEPVEEATPELYAAALRLIGKTAVVSIQVTNFGINPERLKTVNTYAAAASRVASSESITSDSESEADANADADADAPPPNLASQLVLFHWPQSGLPATHQAYIADLVDRNRVGLSAWRVGPRYVEAVGAAFGLSAAGNAIVGKMDPALQTRDLVMMGSLDLRTHRAGLRGRSQEFTHRILKLIDGGTHMALDALVVQMRVTGIGLLTEHRNLVKIRAREKGVAHLIPDDLPLAD